MGYYSICGFAVASEIPFPGAVGVLEPVAVPDVAVRLADIPDSLVDPAITGPVWQAKEDVFLLNIPGLLRLQVKTGREILVAPAHGRSPADIAPFVLSTGFGVLLHQRGCLVLHAAAVAWHGQGIVLCGPAGAGKSTLAAALCRAGCNFIGDDLAAVNFAADGRPVVMSDGRQHRLWADAIAHLNLGDRQEAPVRGHLLKFHLSPEPDRSLISAPLAAVIVLRERLPRTRFDAVLERLELADAAPILRAETYKKNLARKLGQDARLFMQTARLLQHTTAWRLERTFDFAAINENARLVLSTLGETGET